MQNTVASQVFIKDADFSYSPDTGLQMNRHYTKEGVNPFDMFEYELRSSVIREPSGQIIFEMHDVEVPKTWSQVATDILAQKYFRKTGVPQYNEDGTPQLDENGNQITGSEKSMKQVAHRMAGTWRYWGEKHGYFATKQDAQIFYDELVYMLINQMVAPNSPQWFNTGLNWAYGINGPAQGHYYPDPTTGEIKISEDAYTHPQPHACGRYNTKLFTDKGILNLGEVVEKEMIGTKVFDGSNFVGIKAVKNNGIQKLFRATLKNGNYIDFTDDHLIWAAEKADEKFKEYNWKPLNEIVGCAVYYYSYEDLKNTNGSGRSEQTVVAIDNIGEEEVYDIQTESGKFCANGVVVHNCFIQSVNDDLVNEGGIMDLWVREARLFKYGSGTGSNFSNLRGEGESLSGGGASSGLMSWLKIGDRAAGAIKSGGTTRRAAKMVIVNIDHPDIEKFIQWKVNEEKKVAALLVAGYDSSYEGEAYQTISGQNSNNTVRVSQEFMEAVEADADWMLTRRTDGQSVKEMPARELWNKTAEAAWACADPGLQFDTTINDWHTCPRSGRINASNPCSEYMFLDDTACNLASINLGHYYDVDNNIFDIESFTYTTRMWTVVLEISVLMAQYPSKQIAQGSYDFRTLGLGYANVGSVLMTAGLPYDSTEAMNFAAAITAIMTAESYATSSEMAKALGTFVKYEENKDEMLKVIRNHRRAAYNAPAEEYEDIAVPPTGIDIDKCGNYLLQAARASWDKALEMGEKHGFHNAQVTVLAPTGTIGLIMDCATTGVEPDFALVKFKKLAGGGYFKIVNSAVPSALRKLNYNEQQIDNVIKYLKGSGSLVDSPHINRESLKDKGLMTEEIDKIEKSLSGVFELQFTFNSWTLGEECLSRLGFSKEQYEDPAFNLLKALEFTDEEIAKANEHVCGAMTIEGAPHLRNEHYAVFDTASKNGKKGKRYIHYLGHIRMMASVQPFISGAISKTINMPNEATIEDVKTAYIASWKLGLKANAIYRDGCKLSQPLSTRSSDKNEADENDDDLKSSADSIELIDDVSENEVQAIESKPDVSQAVESEPHSVQEQEAEKNIYESEPFERGGPAKKYVISNEEEMIEQMVEAEHVVIDYAHDGTSAGKRIYLHGEQRKLPYKRSGITVKAKVAGQSVFIRTGEYPDGRLGEVFIDMYKEGAAFRSALNLFAVSVSTGLQYGIPLEEYVNKFTFTRFEPSGMTDHPNIKSCTSVIDFVFRVLGMEYLGRMDFVQVKPKGIQKNRVQRLAKMMEMASGQNSLDFEGSIEEFDKQMKDQLTLPSLLKTEPTEPLRSNGEQAPTKVRQSSANKLDSSAASVAAHLIGIQSDAPPCPTCGHTTIRNGTCYKCLNCGSTTGCS
ncbi:MAG: vitamin B12-dependent ribonucleotide reductase [bacterium]